MNKYLATGNIAFKPEPTIVGDTIKTTLRLAVKNIVYKKHGEKENNTIWLFVTVWGGEAGRCCKYLDKGSKVLVEGFLKVNEWTEDDGKRRFATEIVAQRVEFLDKVGDKNGSND